MHYTRMTKEQIDATVDFCHHKYSEYNINITNFTRTVEYNVIEDLRKVVTDTYLCSETTNEQRDLFDKIMNGIKKYEQSV